MSIEFFPELKKKRTAYCHKCYKKRASKRNLTEAEFLSWLDREDTKPCKHCGAEPWVARRAREDEYLKIGLRLS